MIIYKELRGWPSIKIITVQREFCLRPFLKCYIARYISAGEILDNHLVRFAANRLRAHVLSPWSNKLALGGARGRGVGQKKFRGPSKCQITFYDAGILGKRVYIHIRAIQGRAPSDYTVLAPLRIDTHTNELNKRALIVRRPASTAGHC